MSTMSKNHVPLDCPQFNKKPFKIAIFHRGLLNTGYSVCTCIENTIFSSFLNYDARTDTRGEDYYIKKIETRHKQIRQRHCVRTNLLTTLRLN